MHEIPKEEFVKTVNEVAREVYSKTKNNLDTLTGWTFREALARATCSAIRGNYVFYTEKPVKVKKIIQEQFTLPDGRVVSVPTEVEEWTTKRLYRSIGQMFRRMMSMYPMTRVIDYSSLPTKEKFMTLLEFCDRTGLHVTRKTLDRHKGDQRSLSEWDVLFG